MSALAADEAPGTRQLIEDRLDCFFQQRARQARAYGRHYERLWTLASEGVFGGKMVRPLLLIDLYDALAPEHPDVRPDALIDLGVAVELLHFSFILHDDVIDGDIQRRGRPNLIGALLKEAPPGVAPEAAVHWAHSGAILMGDLVLSGLHQVLARVDLPVAQRMRIFDLVDFTIAETVAGEYTDVALSDGVLSGALPRVLDMTTRKTATYTFELPLRMAATLAGASSEVEEHLALMGRQLGLAFQLQDDLLSTFGEVTEHGKDRYSDLREGKQTTLIAFARHTDAWSQISPLIGDPHLSLDHGELAARLLHECGARHFVEQLVDERFDAVDRQLSAGTCPLPLPARELLHTLAGQLRRRRS